MYRALGGLASWGMKSTPLAIRQIVPAYGII